MSRTLSGQYTIDTSNTSEKALDANVPNGSVVRIRNTGSNPMFVGNAGDDSVDANSGFEIPAGKTEAIRIKDYLEGGESDLYVYGTSGDTLNWLVIA